MFALRTGPECHTCRKSFLWIHEDQDYVRGSQDHDFSYLEQNLSASFANCLRLLSWTNISLGECLCEWQVLSGVFPGICLFSLLSCSPYNWAVDVVGLVNLLAFRPI